MGGGEVVGQGVAASRWPPLVRILGMLVLLGVVGLMAWTLQGGIAPSNEAPRVGALAPSFTLENLDGQQVSLSDFRGKTVILNFWATWCVPCRTEMPAIDAVARADPNVVVLAIDLQEGEEPVRDYAQKLGLSFSPLLDSSGQVTTLYHVNSLPSSFFIGPDGTIRAISVGPMDQRILDGNVRRAT